uniref:Histidyl-tRNA synthetase n=1 Tax=Cyprinus carpio TaxID=7962 RepID=A0A8C1TH97_CYPCA
MIHPKAFSTDAEVARLLRLKAQLGREEGKHQFVLKTAKGTRDYNPKQMAVREKIFNIIISCFKYHGAETTDTPSLSQTWAGKFQSVIYCLNFVIILAEYESLTCSLFMQGEAGSGRAAASAPQTVPEQTGLRWLTDMKLLFSYLELFQVTDKVSDSLTDHPSTGVHACLAGGGRYDGLVGMFDPKGRKVSALGLRGSFPSWKKVRTTETQVLVASAKEKLLEERLKLTSELWNAGIKVFLYEKNLMLLSQLQHCEETGIPLVAIIGEQELSNCAT